MLSSSDILKISKKFYSTSPLGTVNKKEVRKLVDSGEVLFGFKCGLIICKTGAHNFVIEGTSTYNSTFKFKELVDKIESSDKPFSSNFIKTSPILLKSFASEISNALLDFELNPDTERYNERSEKLNVLQGHLDSLSDINTPIINDFITIIKELENQIIEKGGEDKLFEFLKVKTFLDDFRSRVIADIEDIKNTDLSGIEQAIRKDEKEKSLDDIANSFSDLATGGGLATKLNSLFEVGPKIKDSLEFEVMTLNLYKSLAASMTVFYVTNKRVEYFELFTAFEKLGVFNSSWQKEVSAKLSSIEDRLTMMTNQLVQLNEQFQTLIQNTDGIVQELRQGFSELNSSLEANNILQGITAYHTYKNAKGLSQ